MDEVTESDAAIAQLGSFLYGNKVPAKKCCVVKVIPILLSLFIVPIAYWSRETQFGTKNVIFMILSQCDDYHKNLSYYLEVNIQREAHKHENRPAKVHVSHKQLPTIGVWTIIPIFSLTIGIYDSPYKWVVFLDPHTIVRYGKLMDRLREADKRPDVMWIGHALSDEEPSALHDFRIYHEISGGLRYPNILSGFAVRLEMMKKYHNPVHKTYSFTTTDAAFELAEYFYGPSKQGPLLTHDSHFCIENEEHCATYVRKVTACSDPIREDSVYFAVNTFSGPDASWAYTLKNTWGKYVTNLMFFSDEDDPELPAVELPVPNAMVGDCMKTLSILNYVIDDITANKPHIKWIVLAHDKTMLGVKRLSEVLSCFPDHEPNIIGERYGNGYSKKNHQHAIQNHVVVTVDTVTFPAAIMGHDYIVGAAGAVYSVAAAKTLLACQCSGLTANDDITLGMCAPFLSLTLTHLHVFHQYPPGAYPRKIIEYDRPVSFSGLEINDAEELYQKYFKTDDMNFTREKNNISNTNYVDSETNLLAYESSVVELSS